jgi:hypothetical protein
MGLFAKFFGAVPKSERGGLSLDDSAAWEVGPTTNASQFLRALSRLLDTHSIIYFEGTTDLAVEQFLEKNKTPNPEKLAIGTIWPRPKIYHMPYTAERISALADLIDTNQVAHLCTHIHAYTGKKVLVEWHDAFGTDPMRISLSLKETSVSGFAQALGSRYGRS